MLRRFHLIAATASGNKAAVLSARSAQELSTLLSGLKQFSLQLGGTDPVTHYIACEGSTPIWCQDAATGKCTYYARAEA